MPEARRVYLPLQPHMRGTVSRYGPPGYVWVDWDNGTTFPVAEDSTGPESELEEE